MPIRDSFPGQDSSILAPSPRFPTITPSNDTDLVELPKFLYIGTTGGALTAVDEDGNTSVFWTVAGQKLKIRPRRIMATGTDATPIIACY